MLDSREIHGFEGDGQMRQRRSDDYVGKRSYRTRRLNRVLRVLIGAKKTNVTFATHPERYYSHVYVQHDLWDTVCFLARVSGVTKMEAVRRILQEGLSSIFGRQIDENDLRVEAMRARGVRPTPTPFVGELIRWAEAKGYNIKRLFV